ncbi:cyclin-dependent kinase inhibitor 1B [Electrophorus electricus]|uniref:Cyclin-dependent kinase inhibitor domain-containing protein n=1 Tax=Electrophorus electricus TaxID=8005 RepID=A0A4W4DPG3_ELEEL|nr:cyclin-dependent kinase inhibitor 1B [Electrophorus electricus]
MSNVQLSVSTLGRLAVRRTFPLHHRDSQAHSSVRRSLFGPVDHVELNREIKSKLREISERDQKRWNFNFDAGTPLHGDYEWEETAVEASPAFYQESVHVGRNRLARLEEHSAETCVGDRAGSAEERFLLPDRRNAENSAGNVNSGKPTCKPVLRDRRKRTESLTTTRITDFYVRRRNADCLKERESVCQKSFPSAADEQTPRKRIR